MGIFKRGRPSKQDPPKEPGIYSFRNKATGENDYVGETSNLQHRKREHADTGKLGPEHDFEWKAADRRSTSRTRRETEKERIGKEGPSLNKRSGGGGRWAKGGSGRRPA